MFNKLFELKQDSLMLERLRYGSEFAEEQFDYYIAHSETPTTLEEVTEQIEDFHKNWICSYIPNDVHSMWLGKEHNAYTSEFHYRKKWNEIPNDKITQYFLNLICKMISISTEITKRTRFVLRLSDFNDFNLYFNTENGARNFADTFGVDEAELFRINANQELIKVEDF